MSDTTKNRPADGLIPARLANRAASKFVRELRTLARQQVKGSEFGPDEHILWHAAERIDELEAKLARVESVQRYSMMKSEAEDGTLTIKFVEDADGIFVDYKHLKQALEQ